MRPSCRRGKKADDVDARQVTPAEVEAFAGALFWPAKEIRDRVRRGEIKARANVDEARKRSCEK
jgi:hypothetical protein